MSRIVTYTDAKGRQWAKNLPDSVPDSDAAMGFEVGPPSLEPLGLPEEVEVRLHNELFERRLWTLADVKRRRMDVLGAIQSAFKVDAGRIVQLYQEDSKHVQIQTRITKSKTKVTKRR